jgi:hypothetical protein
MLWKWSEASITISYGIQKRHDGRKAWSFEQGPTSSLVFMKILTIYVNGAASNTNFGVSAVTYEPELIQFLWDNIALYKEFTYKSVNERKKNEEWILVIRWD